MSSRLDAPETPLSSPSPPPGGEASAAALGRLCIVLAALFWSTSGAFTKVLTRDTDFGLNQPAVTPLQIAFFRALFAGVALLPLLRPRDLGFRPAMLPMMTCFALMNATFVSALALGTAANAILLQYTAPMWMFLASVWWLGEKADYRSLVTVLIGLVGIGVIIFGGWHGGELSVIGLGLASGFAYAGVVIFLRVLRTSSAIWLTVLNHLFSALVLVPFIYHLGLPTGPQLLWLFVYGAGQMAVPYWLMARGVRSVSAQEAGAITLLEPLLNPLWAFLISGEQPTEFTMVGGAFILGALVYRYWPGRRAAAADATSA